MATMRIDDCTNEREVQFWKNRDLSKLLPKLGECIGLVAALYTAIEEHDNDNALQLEAVSIEIVDNEGWQGDGYQGRDFSAIITAPKDLLMALASCPDFRDEFLGGMDAEEARAEIKD